MTAALAFSGIVAQAQDAGSKPASAENPAAVLQHRYSFTTDASDSVGHADGTLEGAATISGGQVHLDGTRGTYVNLPGGLIAGDPRGPRSNFGQPWAQTKTGRAFSIKARRTATTAGMTCISVRTAARRISA